MIFVANRRISFLKTKPKKKNIKIIKTKTKQTKIAIQSQSYLIFIA